MSVFVSAAAPAAQPNAIVSLLPLLAIGVVMYFLMIRPQQKKQRAQRELISQLEVGDEVLTIGGVYGTIRAIDADSDDVILEVAPGSTIRMVRGAIARPVNPQEPDDEEVEDEDDFEDADPDPAD